MDIIEAFFKEKTLASIQIDSYNEFIVHTLPLLLKGKQFSIRTESKDTIFVTFDSICVHPPVFQNAPLYPYEARTKDLTYECIVYVNLIIDKINENDIVVSSNIIHQIPILRIPVMIKSALCNLILHPESEFSQYECPNDVGGYFIVKGTERVIVSQERIRYNYIYINTDKNYQYTADLRSIKGDGEYSIMIQLKIDVEGVVHIFLPKISTPLPLSFFIALVGIDPLELSPDFFSPSELDIFQRSLLQVSRDEAVEFLLFLLKKNPVEEVSKILKTKKKEAGKEYLWSIDMTDFKARYVKGNSENDIISEFTETFIDMYIRNEIFPHLGLDITMDKILFLMLVMCRKLIAVFLGKRVVDDKDAIANKRIDMTGDLIGNLVKGLLKSMIKGIVHQLEKKKDCELTIVQTLQKSNINTRIYQCFSKGLWALPKSNYIRQGVSQVLNRQSYLGTLSHLRRMVVPIGKESKNTQVRQLHASSFGFLCAVESPEVFIF